MKEIVIISGKGGTGKTTIAAALASVAAHEVLMADCDVDAADLHLILKPQITGARDFFSGFKAEIDPGLCINCGACSQVCRFDAISISASTHIVTKLDCEGCGYCAKICPAEAILMQEQNVGQLYHSQAQNSIPLVHARLGIGADNSGKLVAAVKKAAKAQAESRKIPYVLVDGSPGIGCPVISSLSGANLVLLVAEPSISGVSDLKRLWHLCKSFKIPGAAIINKCDINPYISLELATFFEREAITLLDSFIWHEDFSASLAEEKSLPDFAPQIYKARFEKLWNQLKELIGEQI